MKTLLEEFLDGTGYDDKHNIKRRSELLLAAYSQSMPAEQPLRGHQTVFLSFMLLHLPPRMQMHTNLRVEEELPRLRLRKWRGGYFVRPTKFM